MSSEQFLGMLIIAAGSLIGLCTSIVKPITKNTEQMTKLTGAIEHLTDRMDNQDKEFRKHVEDFEEYKEHMKRSQKKQWDEIDLHHDKLIEHRNEIEQLKKGNNETQRKD